MYPFGCVPHSSQHPQTGDGPPIAEGTETFCPKGHDIVFDHVDFAYDKEAVLQDVSFTAREGEITALVGPSGSGKSTCARLAARLWDVTGGSIRVDGVAFYHLILGRKKAGDLFSDFLLGVPPVGGWYSVLKIRVRMSR